MIGRIGDWFYRLWLRWKYRKYTKATLGSLVLPPEALIDFKVDTRQAKRALKKLVKAERRAVPH